MAPPAVLDASVIDALRQLTPPGEPDILAEVFTLFLEEAPPRIERMRNAAAGGDIKEVHRAAHSLKGSAGNIGARAMYDVCSVIDERGKAGDLAGAAALVDAVQAEFDKVESEIHRLMKSGS
jgi:HPt (histidine-containing phosphotransfer) domain-containing protein